MAFCSAIAFALVKGSWVAPADMSRHMYMRAVVPISALYAATLWLGNAAYLYLSVSFIQMLKVGFPGAGRWDLCTVPRPRVWLRHRHVWMWQLLLE